MPEFIPVCRASDIPDPGKRTVVVQDRIVVVFRVDNEFFCLDDVCTHDGGPLGEGTLQNHSITCPRHGARFDIRTGQVLCMPATEPTTAHDVKVQEDQVFVRLTDPDA